MGAEKATRMFGWVLLAMAAVLVSGCGRNPTESVMSGQEVNERRALAKATAMGAYLPVSGEVEGVSGAVEPNPYIESDMPSLLKDDAGTYQRLGVVGIMQAHFNTADGELEARLMDAQTSTQAEAVYLWTVPEQAKSVAAGNEGSADGRVLTCWKGEYCLEILGDLSKEGAKKNALALALKVMEKIKEPGKISPAVAAMKKVIVDPAPAVMKIVYSESELQRATVRVPYYSERDILSLEKYGAQQPVEVTLASVNISEANPGLTVFFVAKYPGTREAGEAVTAYHELTKTDPNPLVKDALLVQDGDVVGGVWRGVAGSDEMLKKIMTELKNKP